MSRDEIKLKQDQVLMNCFFLSNVPSLAELAGLLLEWWPRHVFELRTRRAGVTMALQGAMSQSCVLLYLYELLRLLTLHNSSAVSRIEEKLMDENGINMLYECLSPLFSFNYSLGLV